MTRRCSPPALAGLLACLALAPGRALAERPPHAVAMAERAAHPAVRSSFLTPPWQWVSAGQPLLSSPLLGNFPGAAAALAPGPWLPGPLFASPWPGVASTLVDDRQGLAHAELRGEGEAAGFVALNFSSSAILNVGVSNVR